jgi:hypothetical protein
MLDKTKYQQVGFIHMDGKALRTYAEEFKRNGFAVLFVDGGAEVYKRIQ